MSAGDIAVSDSVRYSGTYILETLDGLEVGSAISKSLHVLNESL